MTQRAMYFIHNGDMRGCAFQHGNPHEGYPRRCEYREILSR
jgi:hypothetical protein